MSVTLNNFPDVTQANVLQLHCATTQPNWPLAGPNGSAMPSPVLFGNAKWGSRMLIRDDYEGLFNEIPLALADAQFTGIGVHYQGIMILGNAGVGKTNFLAAFASKKLQPIVGQRRPTIVFIQHNRGTPIIAQLKGEAAPDSHTPPPRLTMTDVQFANDINEFRDSLMDPSTYLLIDPGAKGRMDVAISPIIKATLVLVLSPTARRRVEDEGWLKDFTLGERFLPCWSNEELLTARRLLHPTAAEKSSDNGSRSPAASAGSAVASDSDHDSHSHSRRVIDGEIMAQEISQLHVQTIWELYGGIARAVFNESEVTLKTRRETAIEECQLDAIMTHDPLNRLHGYSSMLLHYTVESSKLPVAGNARQLIIASQKAAASRNATPAIIAAKQRLPFELQDPPLRVSTQWVMEQLFDAHARQKQKEVVQFLDDCAGRPKFAGIRGGVLEPYAHSIFSRQGAQKFWVQQLNVAGGRTGNVHQVTFEVSGARAKLGGIGGITIAELTSNQYGDHLRTNEATHDAVKDPDTTIQVTASETHFVVVGGLHTAEASLRAKLQPSAQAAFRLKHYFAVPRDKFHLFNITASSFKPTPGKTLPLNVDYYVLMMEDPIVTVAANQPIPGLNVCSCGGGVKCLTQRCECRSNNRSCSKTCGCRQGGAVKCMRN